MHRVIRTAGLAAAILFWGAAGIRAQSTLGTILGSVTDPSGALVAGAKVRVTELKTNAVRQTATGATGSYEVASLNPGIYEIVVEQAGFRQFVQRGVVLETRGQVRVNAALTVGDAATQVTVEGALAPIETETSRISTIQGQTLFQHLPTQSAGARGAFQLFVLTPGVQATPGGAYTINGSRAWSNGFSIDGTNTGSPLTGAQESEQRPHFDLLQEARVDSVNNSAEFAHSGHLNLTTKSGTNEFHGSAEYSHTNSALGARDFFAVSKPQLKDHFYVAHISGPVVLPRLYNGRNRTFILLGYNGFTQPREALLTPNVPSMRMRQGDFSRLLDARGNLTPVRDPFTGQPFPGNVIPTNRLNRVALNYQSLFYPEPNFGGPDLLAANHRSTYATNDGIQNDLNARLDHQISSNNRAYFRFSRLVQNFKRNAAALPTIGRFRRIRFNYSWTFSDTHTFTPTLLHEFRLGGFSKRWPIDAAYNGAEAVSQVGLTGFPGTLPTDVAGFPVVNITGFTAISAQNTSLENLMNHDLHDVVTWIRGGHSFKFGFNTTWTRQNEYPISPSNVFGNSSFNAFASNHAYADFLLGLPRTSTRSEVRPQTEVTNREFAFFAQDDWKATRNLTLNLGLRYQFTLPFRERDGQISNFDPSTGAIVIPQEATRASVPVNYPASVRFLTAAEAGFPTDRLLSADWNSLAPRVGFAYRIGSRSQTVLRGGFGVFYNSEVRKASLRGGPLVGSQVYDNTITAGRPLYQWPTAFPGTAANPLGVQSATGVNPYLRDSYTMQWNFTVERELWWQTGLRVSYIGTPSRQLPYRRNLNQPAASLTPFTASRRPYPQFNVITYTDSGAVQSYNALQVEANRRYRGGLTLNAHYTWAKNLTDALDSNQLGAVIENSYDRRRERGDESYTPRQRVTASLVYEAPFGKGKRFGSAIPAWLNGIAGGWTVSAIYFARTGFYFTPSFAGADPSNTGSTGGRPDRLADGNLPSGDRSYSRWFDASAFAVPQPGRFGNSGVNVLQGPGSSGLSMGFFKYLPIYERMKLRMSANVRNALNHPAEFNNPAANISAPGQVGAITGGGNDFYGARTVMLGIRLEW